MPPPWAYFFKSAGENDPAESRFRKIVFAGFVLTGVVTTILGPILPHFIARWSLNDSQAGFFFTAQFVGSMSGVGAFTILARRNGLRVVVLTGYLLMSVGSSLIGAPAHLISLLGTFVTGCSLGMVITASNLLIAMGPARKRASAVSWLNVAWGLGAVSCPALIAAAAATIGLGWFLWLFAAATGAVFLSLSACPAPNYVAAQKEDRLSPDVQEFFSGFSGLANLSFLFFLYIGIENSFSGWSASFAKRMEPGHVQMTQLAPALFWAALLLGRILAPAVLRRVSELHVAQGGIVLIVMSSLALLLAAALPAAMIGITLAGFGCAAIFPILVAWLTSHPGISRSAWRGVPFATGNLGGATLPWLVGAVSTRFGGLKTGFVVVVLASVLLMIFTRAFYRRGPAIQLS